MASIIINIHYVKLCKQSTNYNYSNNNTRGKAKHTLLAII